MNSILTFRTSSRAKRVAIVVHSSSEVEVRMPRDVSEREGRRFVEAKREWILGALTKFARQEKKLEGAYTVPKGSRRDLETYRSQALLLVKSRLAAFNKLYAMSNMLNTECSTCGFTYGNISIRNTKSRWGSCSKKRNLNFNYRIVFLPQHLADYLVVHELCHLGEFNHSKKFWNLVGNTIPDFKEQRRELRRVKFA